MFGQGIFFKYLKVEDISVLTKENDLFSNFFGESTHKLPCPKNLKINLN